MIYNIREWVLKSPDIVQTLNRILKHYYNVSGEPIPENKTKIKTNQNCVLKFCRHKGKYQRIAELDFKSFYPSIVRGLKLNPKTDHLKAYSYVLEYLTKELNSISPSEDSARKIKGFITKMCSGWLNCEDFIFYDSQMHRKVLRFGKEIMQKAVEITDNNPNFKILRTNTDGMYVQSISPHNIMIHFGELVHQINQGINTPFLQIRIKGIWTEIHIFALDKFFVNNDYSKNYAFKGMEDWGYNLRLRGKL